MTAAVARFFADVDDLLRGTGRFGSRAQPRSGAGELPLAAFAAIVAGGGFAFGAVMGGFSGRPLQMLYSGIKVPLLLAAATILCLPGFYALNSVLGLRDDFGAACRGVLAAQATLAAALAACAPLQLVAYASSGDYPQAVRASGACFLLATCASQITLSRHYAPLVARDGRHRVARRLWALLYVFVAIQAAWVLRPFVGAPTIEPSFVRSNAWSNAYVVLFRDVLGFG